MSFILNTCQKEKQRKKKILIPDYTISQLEMLPIPLKTKGLSTIKIQHLLTCQSHHMLSIKKQLTKEELCNK